MSTEYRRGIPSYAHVEAATRLGLEWRRESHSRGDFLTRFRYVDGQPYSNWATYPELNDYSTPASSDEHTYSYRPIRPDGTPADWEVLDQEVARVGQQGQPEAQPRGFRADLWRALSSHLTPGNGCRLSDTVRLDWRGFRVQNPFFTAEIGWPAGFNSTDILARWTVYQELKPLYDLVDGAQGEAAMPRDVEAEWSVCSGGSNGASGNWRLSRDGEGLYAQGAYDYYGVPLRNFAAVLDAVAERRVAERQASPLREQRAPTVTSAQPEPRRFADVRPDRHGWRWWRVYGYGEDGARIECRNDNHFRWFGRGWVPWPLQSFVWPDRTVIPTDEQGNPVSWEAAGFAAEAVRGAQESVQRAANDATPARSLGDIEWTVTVEPATGMVRSTHTARIQQATGYAAGTAPAGFSTESPTPPRPGQFSNNPTTLPRFTTDELDDVDHSKTTKLDEVTLRRGKLPTVEQIAKYREVRTRRTGGTVADALKESRIDCEVAQYVLERWAGGLGDEEAHDLIHSTATLRVVVKGVVHIKAVDSRVVSVLSDCYSLDTSEKPSPTVQRERQEAEERRQRLAELRQRLAAERAAQPQEMAKESEASRFDLIEPDPQADPTASIRAWEARQAAAKVRLQQPHPRITKLAAVPRRPAIEVVDAETDGLSRSEAFVALFGRALNGGC